MSATVDARGVIFRCPICGSEVMVVGDRTGEFTPHCCNRLMTLMRQKAVIYHCPVCGAEVAMLRKGKGVFTPHCCNRDMEKMAA
jgi:endogenous inhibitor of DNA gyrase (YacG/DUF329 family)